jgi:hypothetical protein
VLSSFNFLCARITACANWSNSPWTELITSPRSRSGGDSRDFGWLGSLAGSGDQIAGIVPHVDLPFATRFDDAQSRCIEAAAFVGPGPEADAAGDDGVPVVEDLAGELDGGVGIVCPAAFGDLPDKTAQIAAETGAVNPVEPSASAFALRIR